MHSVLPAVPLAPSAVSLYRRGSSVPRRCTVTLAIASPARVAGTAQARPALKGDRLRVIRLISACVEANAVVTQFETLACRSAMVGFASAVATELVVDQRGMFGGLTEQEGIWFAVSSALLVATSAALATMPTTRTMGERFTEAVMTSMTAVQRSKGSVSTLQVDKAVDFVMDSVIDKRMLYTHLMEEDKYI